MAKATSNNPGGVRANITIDGQGWFKAVSPQFLDLIGQPVEALAGVNLVDLIHPHDAADLRRFLTHVAEGASHAAASVRLFSADDQWLALDVMVPKVADGRITVDLVEHPIAVSPPVASPGPVPKTRIESAESADADDDSTYSELPEHMAYMALMPGDDVPDLRVAARASAGGAETPMLEVDAEGRTVFVAGPWSTLTTGGTTGVEVLEELLNQSGQGDQIIAAVGAAIDRVEASQHEILVPGLAPRWVRISAIPSPHRVGVFHALVSVVSESGLNETAPIAAPADVVGQTPTGIDEPEAAPAGPKRLLWAVGALVTYLAIHVLYFGPVHDWPSPLQGWFNSEECHAPEICDDGELVSDELLDSGPITTELVETQAIVVGDGQVWRPIGTSIVGEVHAIASSGDDNGAYVADLSGQVFLLDAEGATESVIGLGGTSSTLISDLVRHEEATWALDAGLGRIARIDDEGAVTTLDIDSSPLRNARGIGSGADASLWVASTAAEQLTNVGPDGSLLAVVAVPGRQPTDVVEVQGGFWIIDAQEMELVRIDASGATLSVLPLGAFTSLESPHLSVTGDQLWVTEPEMSTVFAVDLATGEPVGDLVELVRPDGSRVTKAIGIAAAPDGRLWIVDSRAGGILILDN